ncbi:MAG: HAD hydrolase family protein [Chitinophagaceae bacterium]|nr:HAD hydrolase family protein [Chitinophagaceae bacterium]
MNLIGQFRQITTFVLDVDGVMTDGAVYVFEDGQQVRGMSTRDGFALQLAIKKGYRVIVISGGISNAVVQRLNKLGVAEVHMGVHDKRALLLQYMQDNNLSKDELLYMGDDIPDYMAMLESGLPCAPADAAPEIKKIAHYISSLDGGRGCVREVIEKVLKLNGHWELVTDVTSK